MEPIRYELWESAPGPGDYAPYIMHYKPDSKKSDAAVFLIPGSAYCIDPSRPVQEGDRVARYLADKGLHVFVLIYRVYPTEGFPYPLLDGRRGMRFVRHHAKRFGIDGEKIVSLGYSAGGHLAASLVGYHEPMAGEGLDAIDTMDYRPNLQALCYPVISLNKEKPYTNKGSANALLGEKYAHLTDALSFEISQSEKAPPSFIFHNFDDTCVGVENSLLYACRLKALGTEVEMHVYPHSGHGIGLPLEERADLSHAKDWLTQFVRWLGYHGLLSDK